MFAAFPSIAGPKHIVVVAEPSRPICLHQSVQRYNDGYAMEITGIKSVGRDHLVFVSVGHTGNAEVEEFVVVPDIWVNLSVWRIKWWLLPKKALFNRFLKPVVLFIIARGHSRCSVFPLLLLVVLFLLILTVWFGLNHTKHFMSSWVLDSNNENNRCQPDPHNRLSRK
jgi:hypothetical protein